MASSTFLYMNSSTIAFRVRWCLLKCLDNHTSFLAQRVIFHALVLFHIQFNDLLLASQAQRPDEAGFALVSQAFLQGKQLYKLNKIQMKT